MCRKRQPWLGGGPLCLAHSVRYRDRTKVLILAGGLVPRSRGGAAKEEATAKKRTPHQWRRCLAPRCDRFVQPGKAVCPDHVRTHHGRALQKAVHQATATATRAAASPDDADPDAADRRHRAAAEFRARVTRGSYRGLFDPHLSRIVAQAAEERDLTAEIGALRLALAGLLAQEDDPTKLALGVARLSDASVRATRARAALAETLDDDLTLALTKALIEIG